MYQEQVYGKAALAEAVRLEKKALTLRGAARAAVMKKAWESFELALRADITPFLPEQEQEKIASNT